ncbi:GntR family transcriptional regulator [Curtobacterium ammoniigenes]|uniref:GntR family transcriptional regulator n=1 Tax=Curtobacterium ammoniigenes TaxID=395387 RepID=UPI00082FEA10|nr:GntR family transcriptional regulator [Curtobacterium ammoniigenes]
MPIPKTTVENSPRKLLRDVVYDKILAALRDGTLQHGERLNDDELVQWLGVSRTPVREAIAKLVDIGLIEMEANRYTRVARPTFRDWTNAVRAFSGFWESCARWSVPALTDAQATDLRKLVDRADAAREKHAGDYDARLDAVREWIIEHTPNQLLTRAASGALEQVRFALQPAPRFEQWDIADVFDGLREAVANRDGERARSAAHALSVAMEAHIAAVATARGEHVDTW